MKTIKLINGNKIAQFWVISVVLIYGLLLAEYFNTLSDILFYAHPNFTPNNIFTYIMTFNYALMIIMSFVIWIVTSFLYHLFATLLGGKAILKDFQKFTGLGYVVPTIILSIILIILYGIELTDKNIVNFIQTNETMRTVKWLTAIASYLYYSIVVIIVKYLYSLNWMKSIGVVVIPLGSIFLLGQFFAKFIF